MNERNDSAGPPRPSLLARVALRWLMPETERGAVLSELRELWEQRLERDGEAARRWYARQLRGYALLLLRERLRSVIRRIATAGTGSGEASGDGGGILMGIGRDARQSLRGWSKSPVLASTIVLTLGLGLGASTAMFAVVRSVLLEPLPYSGSERLVRIYHAISGNRWNLSVADFQAIEAQQTQFDGVAAYASGERTFTAGDVAERVRVRAVTAGWFDLLGIRPMQGRTFEPADGEPGAPLTALVSWGFWQRQLGADATAVGRTIRLDGEDFAVIGILPRQAGPLEERFEVFPALQLEPPARKGPFMLTVVGRVRNGVDAATAAAELEAINERIFPIWAASWTDSTSTWGMMPLDEFVIGRYQTMLFSLLGAVTLLLLVAATNAAGLLTARAIQRQAELATRAALGASRSRLVSLLVTESVLLALAGTALGMALTVSALRAIRAAGPDLLPRGESIAFDGTVSVFAAALTSASLLIFGLVPALQLVGSRSGIALGLRSGGRTATGGVPAHRVRRALVASQFAIAVPLLAGAALLLNSFLRLQRVDPGFDGDRVLTARITRPASLPPADAFAADAFFWDQLLERVGALPGVAATGLNSGRPPREVDNINNFDPLDRPTPVGETEPLAVWLAVSPGYFDAVRVRLVSGRMFDTRDQPDLGTISALVDRTWADNIYPGEDPVGRQLYEGGCKSEECEIVTIVGVVESVRYLGLDDAQSSAAVGTVYVPRTQWYTSSHYLYVRASVDPLLLAPSIRAIVHEIDPTVPITDVATGDGLIDSALATPRNLAAVVVAFAAIALALAMIGIYGVMSYFVNEHRKDIGIRLALGGTAPGVIALVIGRGMKPVLLGGAIGFVIAAGVTRFISRLLFGVSPYDPTTMGIVALAMLGTAAAACWLPARHAARLDPAQVLRHD